MSGPLIVQQYFQLLKGHILTPTVDSASDPDLWIADIPLIQTPELQTPL